MKSNKSLLASLILGLSSFTNAEIFEATGYGETFDDARKIAVSNAIKSSVGEFVVSKEELNNDDFQQKILSHSNAYIKSLEILSSNKIGDEYEVTVKLDIESQVLLDRIKEANVVRLKNATKNNEILAELELLSTKEKNRNEFMEMVDELIYQPIRSGKKIVDIEIIGKLKPTKPIGNNPDNRVYVSLPIEIGVSKEFISNFKKLLSQVVIGNKTSNKDLGVYEFNISKGSNPWSDYKDKLIGYLPEDVGNNNYEHRAWIENIKSLSKYTRNDMSKIELILLDENDEELASFYFSHEQGEVGHYHFIHMKHSDGKRKGKGFYTLKLLPLCNGDGCFYSVGKTKIDLTFPIEREMISDVKDIQIRFIY